MLGGVHGLIKGPDGGSAVSSKGRSAPALHYGKLTKKQEDEYVTLWPAVFTKDPGLNAKEQENFSMTYLRGDDTYVSDVCLKVAAALIKAKRVESEMTVLQWVTSPWHYAYLPYQSQQSLFRDGETYSEGCVRCSRPFYEYKLMYMWYRYAQQKTESWPITYWHKTDETGNACAPVPFHDESFWSKQTHTSTIEHEQVQSAEETANARGIEEYNTEGGYHNWPTKLFLIKSSPLLRQEYKARSSKKGKLDSSLKDNDVVNNFTYKQYVNHSYRESQVREFWQGDYPKITQGRLSQSKVKCGMRDYCLQRSSKYNNVCRDCAGVLDLAPGLFSRSHRAIFSPGLVVRNGRLAINPNPWWSNLIGRKLQSGITFDPDYLHGNSNALKGPERVAWEAQRRESFDLVLQFLKASQPLPANSNWTKHRSPPDISVQQEIPHTQTLEEADKLRKQAFADVKRMMRGEGAGDPENPLLVSMFREFMNTHIHLDRHDAPKKQEKFDYNARRLEYRNVQKRHGKTQYNNCLVVREFNKNVTNAAQMPNIEDTYTDHTYYATRKGEDGSETEQPDDEASQWLGDGHVTAYNKGVWSAAKARGIGLGNNNPVQWRRLVMSRIFITYSMHRPLTDTENARHIMERMADACNELFGNEQNLADILQFGYKLVTPKKVKADTMGKAQFVIIGKTNKTENMPDFYGDDKSTSYIYDTYQTHVESVKVNGGMEIGPKRHHPHFHLMLTIEHWSYVQLDYYKMNWYLETMFTGHNPLGRDWEVEVTNPDTGEVSMESKFRLIGVDGENYYTDHEFPWVDLKVLPQDNWQDIVNAYVRKMQKPDILNFIQNRAEASINLASEALKRTKENREAALNIDLGTAYTNLRP